MIKYEIWTLAKIRAATAKIRDKREERAIGTTGFVPRYDLSCRIAANDAAEDANLQGKHIKIRDKCQLSEIPIIWQYMVSKIELNGTIHKDRFG